MIDIIPESKHPFTPFYGVNHLVIQFILASFAQTYPLVKGFEEITFEISELDQIFQQFQDSAWSENPLTQLKGHAFLFCQNIELKQRASFHFFLTVHRACSSIQQSREIWAAFCLNKSSKIPKILMLPLKKQAKIFNRSLSTIIRHLPQLVFPYRDNENVIFTLLKHREVYEQIYGEDFLLRFLQYSVTENELLDWLVERYEKRGFEILPLLKNHIKDKALFN